MSGACFFSAKAAYRTGAGLVKVVTVEENRSVMQTLLPEALITTYNSNLIGDKEEIHKIKKDIEWANVIVIGPGLGVNSKSEEIFETVIITAQIPVIIDADAINILAKKINAEKNPFEFINSYLSKQTILTPHLKELSRLVGISTAEIADNFIETIDKCTSDNQIIYAIKDARTIVANGNKRFVNTSGNNGLATGGTGDVLTGIMAALIAQGMQPYEAASLGVYIHGLAGDNVAKQKGKYALMASDVIEAIADICR